MNPNLKENTYTLHYIVTFITPQKKKKIVTFTVTICDMSCQFVISFYLREFVIFSEINILKVICCKYFSSKSIPKININKHKLKSLTFPKKKVIDFYLLVVFFLGFFLVKIK